MSERSAPRLPELARRKSKPRIRKLLAAILGTALALLCFDEVWTQWPGAGSRAGGVPRRPSPSSIPAAGRAPSAPVIEQPVASAALVPAPPTPPALPAAGSSPCPQEMVLVAGDYCTAVLQTCARWLDDETLPFARCSEYHRPSRCIGSRVKQRFCIDRYEYTAPGEALPLNYQSFEKSTALCASLGKRLCTETEWTFACEGEDMLPYPYGFRRESVCNQDRTDLYEPNPHYQILADRRERADARPGCVSPFGVFNLAGNMDESVLREGKEHVEPYRNALKGGWWMAARNRCRPATTAHDDYYKDIQIGTRCCASAE